MTRAAAFEQSAESRRGSAPTKRTLKQPQKMLHITRLTPEEVGLPENATFEEIAAHRKKYGKAQVTPKKIRDLQLAQMAVEQFTITMIALTQKGSCLPAQFFEHIDLLLAHQRQPGAKNGAEADFAKAGKAAVLVLDRTLEQGIIKLGEFRQALEAHYRR